MTATTAPRRPVTRSLADTKPVRLAPLDILRLGLLGIHTRTMRAALSALGISIGIATMIVVTGIPASSQKALMNQLSALGTNMLQAVPVPNQTPPVQLPPQSVDMVRRIGPVTVASAVANTHAEVFRNDHVDADDYAGLTVLAAGPTCSTRSTPRCSPGVTSRRAPRSSPRSSSARSPPPVWPSPR